MVIGGCDVVVGGCGGSNVIAVAILVIDGLVTNLVTIYIVVVNVVALLSEVVVDAVVVVVAAVAVVATARNVVEDSSR